MFQVGRHPARRFGPYDVVGYSLTNDAGLTLGGGAGTIIIGISATEMTAQEFVHGRHHLRVVDSLGKVKRWLQGVTACDLPVDLPLSGACRRFGEQACARTERDLVSTRPWRAPLNGPGCGQRCGHPSTRSGRTSLTCRRCSYSAQPGRCSGGLIRHAGEPSTGHVKNLRILFPRDSPFPRTFSPSSTRWLPRSWSRPLQTRTPLTWRLTQTRRSARTALSCPRRVAPSCATQRGALLPLLGFLRML
jgi:hypothetical protein